MQSYRQEHTELAAIRSAHSITKKIEDFRFKNAKKK